MNYNEIKYEQTVLQKDIKEYSLLFPGIYSLKENNL